jgi:hypothetical protein
VDGKWAKNSKISHDLLNPPLARLKAPSLAMDAGIGQISRISGVPSVSVSHRNRNRVVGVGVTEPDAGGGGQQPTAGRGRRGRS